MFLLRTFSFDTVAFFNTGTTGVFFSTFSVIKESLQEGYPLTGAYTNYLKKIYTNESTLTDCKKVNGKYYLAHAVNTVKGKLQSTTDDSIPFETKVTSDWSAFTFDAKKITNKAEQHLFDKLQYNADFWERFRLHR